MIRHQTPARVKWFILKYRMLRRAGPDKWAYKFLIQEESSTREETISEFLEPLAEEHARVYGECRGFEYSIVRKLPADVRLQMLAGIRAEIKYLDFRYTLVLITPELKKG